MLATSSDPGQSPLEPVCSKSSHLPHFSSSREPSWASQHLEFLFPPQRLSNYNKIRSHQDNHFCPGTTPSPIPFNFQSVTAVRNGSRAPAPGQSHGTGCRCPSPLSREPLLLTGSSEEPDPRTHSAAETLPSVAPLPLPLATHRYHQAGAAGAPRQRRSPASHDTHGPAGPAHSERRGYPAAQSPRPAGGGRPPVEPQHRPARHSGATEPPLHSRHRAPEAAGPGCRPRPGENPGNGSAPLGRARPPRGETSDRGPTHRPQRRSRRCVSQAPALTSAFTRSASGPDHPFRPPLAGHRRTQLPIIRAPPRPSPAPQGAPPQCSGRDVMARPQGLLGVVVWGRPGATGHARDSVGTRTGRGGRGQRLSGAGAGKIEPLFLGVAGSMGEAGRNNTNYSGGGAAAAVTLRQAGDPPGDPFGSPPDSCRQIPAGFLSPDPRRPPLPAPRVPRG